MNSGIYKIENLVNGKCYIGSSKNVVERWHTHKKLLRQGKHCSLHLQRAWNLNGEENFNFFVIEKCDNNKLLEREQYFIDILHPEYNLCPIASSSKGIKHTTKARRNMSIAHMGHIVTPETRAKMSVAQVGRKHSPETRAKISAAAKGRKGRIITPEWRAKLSIAGKGRIATPEARANMSAAAKKRWSN